MVNYLSFKIIICLEELFNIFGYIIIFMLMGEKINTILVYKI